MVMKMIMLTSSARALISHKRVTLIGTILVASLILAMFVPQIGLANQPSSKFAVAGSEVRIVKPDPKGLGTYPKIKLLSTWIKTAEDKDLVISFTSEVVLFTDTKITGKGDKALDDQDKASVKVWVTVDGKKVFPDEITFAERIQTLKGKLSQVIVNPDGSIVKVPEEVELILETTEANGFNFLKLNVGSGVHEIIVYATIELKETSKSGEVSADPWAAIGDRTMVVQEVRLIKDATLGK